MTTQEQCNNNDMPPLKVSAKKQAQSNNDNGAETQAQRKDGDGAKKPQHSAKKQAQSNNDNSAET